MYMHSQHFSEKSMPVRGIGGIIWAEEDMVMAELEAWGGGGGMGTQEGDYNIIPTNYNAT